MIIISTKQHFKLKKVKYCSSLYCTDWFLLMFCLSFRQRSGVPPHPFHMPAGSNTKLFILWLVWFLQATAVRRWRSDCERCPPCSKPEPNSAGRERKRWHLGTARDDQMVRFCQNIHTHCLVLLVYCQHIQFMKCTNVRQALSYCMLWILELKMHRNNRNRMDAKILRSNISINVAMSFAQALMIISRGKIEVCHTDI